MGEQHSNVGRQIRQIKADLSEGWGVGGKRSENSRC